jgi:dihydrofolate synthase/folylpolyglutamate synthase
VLRRAPTIIIDAAHNPAGAQAVSAAIEDELSFAALVAVVAVLRDKDALGILEALDPVIDDVVVTVNSSPRAMQLNQLVELALAVMGHDRVYQAATMPDAIETAVRLAERDAPTGAGVLITGSVVTAGDARRLLRAPS